MTDREADVSRGTSRAVSPLVVHETTTREVPSRSSTAEGSAPSRGPVAPSPTDAVEAALSLGEAIIVAAPTDLASAIHGSLRGVVAHQAVALLAPACATAPLVRCWDARWEQQLVGVRWWEGDEPPEGTRVERFSSDGKADAQPTVLALLVGREQGLRHWQSALLQGAAHLVAARAAQFVQAPVAAELALAHVAVAERDRISSSLEHEHRDSLRSVLTALRGREAAPELRVARATGIASDALLKLSEQADAERRDGHVSVQEQFSALEAELRALLLGTDVSGEYALDATEPDEVPSAAVVAAVAITRTLVLDVLDELRAGRLRVAWQLRDARLEVELVDDGAGHAARGQATGVTRARALATALGGETVLSAVPGWGTRVTVGLPIAPRRPSGSRSPELEAIGRLTSRERGVVVLIAAGLSNREIGERLHLSPHTVKRHISRVFQKLQVGSRAEAARMAQGSGLLASGVDTGSDPAVRRPEAGTSPS
jgi:DNA-binding CsgD family transcriptional regulator